MRLLFKIDWHHGRNAVIYREAANFICSAVGRWRWLGDSRRLVVLELSGFGRRLSTGSPDSFGRDFGLCCNREGDHPSGDVMQNSNHNL